jgi:CheY-like chemotaxis protein
MLSWEDTRMDDAAGPCRVVLVDDDDGVRRALARMLEVSGVQVTDFATAAAALAYLAEHGTDLLVTDLEMPGMDGGALIAAVQTRGLAQRIVLISGQSVDHCAARLRALGVAPIASVHEKPISLAMVKRIVASDGIVA